MYNNKNFNFSYQTLHFLGYRQTDSLSADLAILVRSRGQGLERVQLAVSIAKLVKGLAAGCLVRLNKSKKDFQKVLK